MILCTSAGSAQTQTWIGFGPFLSVKPGVNMSEIMDGRKTGLTVVAPDFGGTLLLSLKNIKLGIMLDLGYNTCKVLDKPENNPPDNQIITTSVNYFSIAPSFTYSGLVIGLNIGMPLSASMDTKAGDNLTKFNDKTDNFNSLMELRFGGMIPLVEDATGRLNITIMGNYMLSTLVKNDNTSFNPSVGSISVGINYLFTVANQ